MNGWDRPAGEEARRVIVTNGARQREVANRPLVLRIERRGLQMGIHQRRAGCLGELIGDAVVESIARQLPFKSIRK
jgi:hypothetical protein